MHIPQEKRKNDADGDNLMTFNLEKVGAFSPAFEI